MSAFRSSNRIPLPAPTAVAPDRQITHNSLLITSPKIAGVDHLN
jgi:hypothetical protein